MNETLISFGVIFLMSDILLFVFDFYCTFIKAVILQKTEGFIHYLQGFSKSFKLFRFEGLIGYFFAAAVSWLNCRILHL